MGRLTDKYTLITGGTSGIGLATAQAFIAEGARVAVTGRNPDTLAEAERILGDKAWVIPADAGDITSQKALAETLAARWPRLDAVFLNAGDVTHAPLEAWQEEAWDRLMNINLKGPFFLIQALLPLLNNPSSIILCGSVSAHRPAHQQRVCREQGRPAVAGAHAVGRAAAARDPRQRPEPRPGGDPGVYENGLKRRGA